MTTELAPIEWEVDIPLVTNPMIIGAWLKAMGATYLLSILIVGTVFTGTGQADQLPLLMGWFALMTAGLALLGLLIMLLVFGNRFRARFALTSKGVVYEGVDRRAHSLARLAVLAGGLRGSPGAAGAGLLAISKERVVLDWAGAFGARYVPRHHTIALRNQWRDLLHLYCRPDNYEQVRARVAAELADKGTTERLARTRSPLPQAMMATGLVVVSCLPLFTLQDVSGLDILWPLLILVFSLATVWLIPLFGWVVLPLLGVVLVQLVLALQEVHEFTLVNTHRYRLFEVLDAGEWLLLALAMAGIVYLGRTAWRAVRGRLVPVLMRDGQGMSG